MMRWKGSKDGSGCLEECPKVDAFIEEVMLVCKKHGMSISHTEGTHGSFEIVDYIEKRDSNIWFEDTEFFQADDSTTGKTQPKTITGNIVMKKAVIEALIEVWEKDVAESLAAPSLARQSTNSMTLEPEDLEIAELDAKAEGMRETKRECADALRMLVDMLG